MSAQSQRPVVYCYDGSERARNALVTGSRELSRSPSLVLTAWRSAWVAIAAVPYAVLPQETVAEVDRAAEDAAVALSGEGAALIDGAIPHVIKATMPVWHVILEFAELHNARMIVVGSRGLGAVESTVLGSVSHGLVNHSHRPVLVVPPENG